MLLWFWVAKCSNSSDPRHSSVNMILPWSERKMSSKPTGKDRIYITECTLVIQHVYSFETENYCVTYFVLMQIYSYTGCISSAITAADWKINRLPCSSTWFLTHIRSSLTDTVTSSREGGKCVTVSTSNLNKRERKISCRLETSVAFRLCADGVQQVLIW